jgi:tetratricopeptide (TPR) repeat protein
VRILLSLAAGTIGATWPGFIDLKYDFQGCAIRASGAFALFLATFLLSPTVLPNPIPDSGMREEFKELQAKLSTLETLRIRVESTRATADTVARLTDDPEVRRLGEQLGSAAVEFDDHYHSQLTPEMAAGLRLAKAQAAVAQGRFADGESLIPDAELMKQTSTAINMLLVRGDAAIGLFKWAEAEACYGKILAIDSEHEGGLTGEGRSLYQLHRFREAAASWSRLINLAGDPKTFAGQMDLATKLMNRGNSYASDGQFTEAIADFERTGLTLEPWLAHTRREFGIRLAMVLLNLGRAYGMVDQATNAIRVLIRATEISEPLLTGMEPELSHGVLWSALLAKGDLYTDQKEGHAITDYNRALELAVRSGKTIEKAVTLQRRGKAYRRLKQFDSSISDLNSAIALWESLRSTNGSSEISAQFGWARFERAMTFRQMGHLTSAILDYNRSVDVWEPLVAGARPDLGFALAGALSNRGDTYASLHQLPESYSDFGRVVAILEPLTNTIPGLSADLAKVLLDRAAAYDSELKATNALADLNRSISLLKPLVQDKRLDLACDLAKALANRGSTYRILNDPSNAVMDFGRGIEVLQPLVETVQPEMASRLAQMFGSRAFELGRLGRVGESILDFTSSINILEPLFKTNRSDLADDLASAFIGRGSLSIGVGLAANARDDDNRAIELLEPLVGTDRIDLAEKLGPLLNNRGASFANSGQFAEAIADFNRLIELLSPLTNGQPRLLAVLARATKNKEIARARGTNSTGNPR